MLNIDEPYFIESSGFTDHRGCLTFFNSFVMNDIKRFYLIDHTSNEQVRAWQGHRNEKKWMVVVSGKFLINVVKPDDWTSPSGNLSVMSFKICSEIPKILFIPSGFANGIKSISSSGKLLVFSNLGLEDAKLDSYKFDKDLWFDWHKI